MQANQITTDASAATTAHKSILTTSYYWNAISSGTQAYWQNMADSQSGSLVICTNRPSLREFGRGTTLVRRCSTGGKWGKSADKVRINVEEMLKRGYVWRTFESVSDIAQKQSESIEEIYANDNH